MRIASFGIDRLNCEGCELRGIPVLIFNYKNFQYLLIVAVLSVANMLGGGRQLLDSGWSWGQEVTECYFYNSQWQQSCVLADLQQ